MVSKAFFVSLLVCCLIALPGIASKTSGSHSKRAIASYAQYVTIPGAKSVGPETCTNCHDAVARNFGHAFHA